MIKFVKYFVITLIVLLAIPLLLLELAGMGFISGLIDSRQSWNEVKNDPVISVMGHWSDLPHREEFDLMRSPFFEGMSEADWITVIETSKLGLLLDEETGSCSMGHFKGHDLCAWTVVGPSHCSYGYNVVANFCDGKLIENFGARTTFICL